MRRGAARAGRGSRGPRSRIKARGRAETDRGDHRVSRSRQGALSADAREDASHSRGAARHRLFDGVPARAAGDAAHHATGDRKELRSHMRQLTRHLYFWVLLAILAGGTIGYVSPETGIALKPLGDGFIALVKMLIAPIIFCTVVLGIAGAGSMKKVGRVGGKALLYFEVVSTFALIIGLTVANLIRPGAGFNADPAALDAKAVADYAKVAQTQTTVDFVMHIIPRTFFDAFTGSGDLLQVLFVAVLFGYAMTHLGKAGDIVHQ